MIVIAILLIFLLRVFYSFAEICFERDWPRHTWRGMALAFFLLVFCISIFV